MMNFCAERDGIDLPWVAASRKRGRKKKEVDGGFVAWREHGK